MIKSFLKRNKIIISISAISIIAIVVFAYCISLAQVNLNNSKDALFSIKARVSKINNYSPVPTRENAELLKYDISLLQKRLFEFKNVFGNIYAKPLLAYTSSLKNSEILKLENEIRDLKLNGNNPEALELKEKRLVQLQSISNLDFELEFIQNWNTYIANMKNSKNDSFSVDDLLINFRKQKGYELSECQSALASFISEFKKNNRDHISLEMENEYLLSALGIPLSLNKIKCKAFITDIEKEINNKFNENGIKIAGGKIIFFEEIPTLPEDGQISRIVDYTRFLDDFYYRLSNSKISVLNSYKKLNGIMGQDTRGFVTFKYQIEIVGTLASIRTFLNSLQNAYSDDKVYVIKSLSMSDQNKQAVQTLIDSDNESSKIERKIRILLGDKSTQLINAKVTVDYIIYKQKLAIL